MRVYCTYCSAEKDRSEGLLPPAKRYRRARIDRIAQRVLREGVPFYILSGKFGLVHHTDDAIPFYDHLLPSDEVPGIAALVVVQRGLDEPRAPALHGD